MESSSIKQTLKTEIPHRDQQIDVLVDILGTVSACMNQHVCKLKKMKLFFADRSSTVFIRLWSHFYRKIASSTTSSRIYEQFSVCSYSLH